MILLVDGALTPAAMVNAVITATEAKTMTLAEWDVKTPEGEAASGTSTDTVVVACTGRGERAQLRGPGDARGLARGARGARRDARASARRRWPATAAATGGEAAAAARRAAAQSPACRTSSIQPMPAMAVGNPQVVIARMPT